MGILKSELMVNIRNASTQTSEEIGRALKTDKNAKFGNSALKKDITRTDDFLVMVKADIKKSENDLSKNAENMQALTDRKEKRMAKYRQQIENIQLKKFQATKHQEVALASLRKEMGNALFVLGKGQLSNCNSASFQQCFSKITSNSIAQSCFSQAMSTYSADPNCKASRNVFEAKMKTFRDTQERYLKLYEKRKKVVDEMIAELDEEKAQKKEIL